LSTVRGDIVREIAGERERRSARNAVEKQSCFERNAGHERRYELTRTSVCGTPCA
jgi:hypothetical protein